jgi:hypothetical protein
VETINGILQNVSSIETVVGDADMISSDSSVSITGLPATEQVDFKVVGFGSAPKAAAAVYGVTRLSDDPAVALTPIALGTNNASWLLLIGGLDTILHKHATAYGASDLTATAAEINQALDGISANVTYTNLNALTGSGSTALHTHSHADLGNKTADDHTQYALLGGRTGGQTLQGGTAASEALTLESTAHATKGEVRAVGNFVPSVTGTYDLGDGVTPKAWKDLWLTGVINVDGTQVVKERQTGWTAPTGTALLTGFATSTATLDQVAQTVKALVDLVLTHHGLAGT